MTKDQYKEKRKAFKRSKFRELNQYSHIKDDYKAFLKAVDDTRKENEALLSKS